ncbi:LysR family transcriptional regulator [Calidifontibacter sp. DB0510]|uniref:LysR family transcriptional regulator n=1 Tax=Metallococcus carri TaxID=1656884 RepID=A0A967B2C4_9MICO|nr:LysR family transcriptional regulator [Metallococcus carri]NHN56105.1 LysR family transcriptional regulator [Metallococcus carri]NOP37438.1 LysR family transcriptional regulator [Calidifontibacter sp. DB2511S]
MSAMPSVDDLELIAQIAETGSVTAAARRLHVAQPSASARLARIERAVGTTLFERDTTGARPTAAGSALADQARHILGHLAGAYAAARDASQADSLTVGTFGSLTASLFPALDALLPQVSIDQVTDHGDVLAALVAEGRMDACVIAIADQIPMPTGVVVHPLGEDELVIFRAVGVSRAGRGRLPLRERQVVFTTYDTRSDLLRADLERWGATARLGITLQTTVAMARRRGHLAVLPRSAVAFDLREGEQVDPLPTPRRLRLSLVTGRAADPRLMRVLPGLRRELGLRPPKS